MLFFYYYQFQYLGRVFNLSTSIAIFDLLFAHLCVCAFLCMNVCARECEYKCLWMCTNVCLCMRACVCVYECACVCACKCVCLCVRDHSGFNIHFKKGQHNNNYSRMSFFFIIVMQLQWNKIRNKEKTLGKIVIIFLIFFFFVCFN